MSDRWVSQSGRAPHRRHPTPSGNHAPCGTFRRLAPKKAPAGESEMVSGCDLGRRSKKGGPDLTIDEAVEEKESNRDRPGQALHKDDRKREEQCRTKHDGRDCNRALDQSQLGAAGQVTEVVGARTGESVGVGEVGRGPEAGDDGEGSDHQSIVDGLISVETPSDRLLDRTAQVLKATHWEVD
jgi:hypothetical protein